MVTAVVLAAGASRRMEGGNKMLFPLNHQTVLETTVQQILGASPGETIVVLGKDIPELERLLQQFPVNIRYNPGYETGLTGSIQTGTRDAIGDGYMICLGDMVLVRPEEYRLLMDAFEEKHRSDPRCICIPRYSGQRGNPVIFSSWYLSEILRHTHSEGCKEIIQSHPGHLHFVEMPNDHILQDMDLPEDYRNILKQFGEEEA
jgi:molybdenum cofactor cytidylyltransferase